MSKYRSKPTRRPVMVGDVIDCLYCHGTGYAGNPEYDDTRCGFCTDGKHVVGS